MSRHSRWYWVSALVVAWSFDFLFWRKAPGISFAAFVALCLGAGFLLTWREGVRPARRSWILVALILLFAVVSFLRAEPLTLFLSYALTVALMAMLAHSFQSGTWPDYSLGDYGVGLFRLALDTVVRPIRMWQENQAGARADQRSRWAGLWAVLRGLLLALPIVAVFAGLLASADPIFSRWLEGALAFLRLQNLREYILRLAYILVGAFLLVGVYLHALFASHEQKLIGVGRPWLEQFLGFTEAAVILGSVDVLFAVFVAVQFRYFFGGQANITAAGFTYSEYARRGFGELVAVAFLSQMLFFGLSSLTRRDPGWQRRTFSALGVGLVLLVIVILISAYQRLQLYEAAYGFSRLRTYTHVFILWLGAWLAALLVLDLVQRLRAFALVTLVAVLGFGLSLPLINVDDFIVRQNVARAISGAELDTGYMASLSDDAVPALAHAQQTLPPRLASEVSAVLACRAFAAGRPTAPEPWPSFTFAHYWAENLIGAEKEGLAAFPLTEHDHELWVTVGGQERPCNAPSAN